ncbi:unnamed protein product, partial [Discosporangium mesarthrocarpum]
WDEDTCACVAKAGHLHILEWARRQGCPWDTVRCCSRAAGEAHLGV